MRQVTPVLEFSPDQLSDTTPAWTDISSDLIEATWGDGKQKDLDDPQAGFATFRLKNTNRRHEPEYAAGQFYPNIRPMRRYRLTVPNQDRQGIEFWGDFEFGADGTAVEWTSGNGAIECKAGAEARQLQYVTSPTPRLGAKAMRFEVASGDQFGASTGERALTRRGRSNDAWPVSAPDGQTAYYQYSFRPLAPWTHPSGWEIFQQFKSDSRYGQPIMRMQVNEARTKFMFSIDSGEFPTATDATNGTNAGTNMDFELAAFAADVWWDVRMKIRWSTAQDGSVELWMKPSSEATWLNVYRYFQIAGIQTLPTTKGDSTPPTLEEFVGFYRNASAFTSVVFHDGYQVGHSWTDVDYPTTAPFDPAWNKQTWDGRDNFLDTQGGSPGGSYENSTSGAVNTGGGITTTSSTDRAKFGSYSLKIVTDGSGSSQGVRHFKTSGSRFDVTAGSTYTCSAWFSGDGFQTVRLEIEYFDSGAVSLGTTQALSRAVRTDFRRHWLTTVAPVGAVTARIGTRWSGTTAGTFYVDGVGLWEGTYGTSYDEGIWYATSYEVSYPDKSSNYSEVIVNCVDGFGLLSLDALELMDPPEAETYVEVADFDDPSFLYPLDDPAGTKAVQHVKKKKRKGKTIKRRWRTIETRSEAEGISGPAGSYKNTPTLGTAGLVLGDPGTAVRFTRSLSQYVNVVLDDVDLSRTAITFECWVRIHSTPASDAMELISGPSDGTNAYVRLLWLDSALSTSGNDTFQFVVSYSNGSTTFCDTTTIPSVDTTYHVVGTANDQYVRIYLNGVLEAEKAASGDRFTQPTGTTLRLARTNQPASTFYLDGTLQHCGVYEKVLSAARISAHYTAGSARGFAQQAAGTRISGIATHDLWSETGIPAGSFQVVPRFKHGQAKLDEIVETIRTEGPDNLLYFDGRGNPVYLPWNYKDGLAVSATLGESGGSELPYTSLDPIYDDEVYNEVTTSTETGVAQVSSDATSSGEFRPRKAAETGLILVDDANAKSVGAAILDEFKDPLFRCASVSLNGSTPDKRTAILARNIGDLIRVKRRPGGGTPIDVVTTIIGQQKTVDRDGNLWCTWNTARGFNASLSEWHLGVSGFSELGSTAVLA